MIRAMLEKADGKPAYVFISSAKDSLLLPEVKKAFLEKMLDPLPENLHLVNTADCKPPCGGPLGGWGYLKDKGIPGAGMTLVVGSDQAAKFDPKTAPMWSTIDSDQRPSIVSIRRGDEGVAAFSSTNARKALATAVAADASVVDALRPFLTDGTNAITDDDVAEMAGALLAVQARWPKKKGGADPYDSVFDEDLDGGRRRRKTYRRPPKRIRGTRRRV